MDVLTAATYFKERPEWANAKVGHIGESMGGTTAMNLMRPYLRRAFNNLYGKPPAQLEGVMDERPGWADKHHNSFWPASRLRCALPLGAMARRKPGQMR